MDATTDDLTVGQAVFCIVDGNEFVGKIHRAADSFTDGDHLVQAKYGCCWQVRPGQPVPASRG